MWIDEASDVEGLPADDVALEDAVDGVERLESPGGMNNQEGVAQDTAETAADRLRISGTRDPEPPAFVAVGDVGHEPGLAETVDDSHHLHREDFRSRRPAAGDERRLGTVAESVRESHRLSERDDAGLGDSFAPPDALDRDDVDAGGSGLESQRNARRRLLDDDVLEAGAHCGEAKASGPSLQPTRGDDAIAG
ncbi:hypothetical protein GTU73_00230 [Rathayibacter sp. VKM Ac-2804]|uniref:hypothetical protein n=1 Tax=Rathayibacter sp. VKM Ac-2804 TaxID=2609257 RepID=UPI00132EE4D6|nr:hypothetical protein [Rathayibacter sp. VKM Ac-2804]QHF22584.1 hypothetical protein GTU73_00230 [Rathayibacter sp. VKM Ac-2804]